MDNIELRAKILEAPNIPKAADKIKRAIPIGQPYVRSEDFETDLGNIPLRPWMIATDTLEIAQGLAINHVNPNQFADTLHSLYEKAGSPRITSDYDKQEAESKKWSDFLGTAVRIVTTSKLLEEVNTGKKLKEIPHGLLKYANHDVSSGGLESVPFVARAPFDNNTATEIYYKNKKTPGELPEDVVNLAKEVSSLNERRRSENSIEIDKLFLQEKLKLEKKWYFYLLDQTN